MLFKYYLIVNDLHTGVKLLDRKFHSFDSNLKFVKQIRISNFSNYWTVLPNQELSGAKSELQEGNGGRMLISYKKGGQPPYNLLFIPPSVYTTRP